MRVKYSCLVFLMFFGYASAAYVEDAMCAEDAPPVKKRRFNAQRKIQKSEKRPQTCGKIEDVCKKLRDAQSAGCYYAEIAPFLHESKRGVHSVLQAVVDVMFQKNVDVLYNPHSHRYLYLGAAPEVDPVPDVNIALAVVLTDSAEDAAHTCLGWLAYCLFKNGYRVCSYGKFLEIYYSLCVLCRVRPTGSTRRAKDLIDFSEKLTKTMTIAQIVYHYEAQTGTRVQPLALKIVRYIFSLGKDVRGKIDNIRRKTRGLELLEEQYAGLREAEHSCPVIPPDFLKLPAIDERLPENVMDSPLRKSECSGMPSDVCTADEGCVFGLKNPEGALLSAKGPDEQACLESKDAVAQEEPLEIAIAEALIASKTGRFFEIEDNCYLRKRASLKVMRGIYWAVRVLCYEGGCASREPVLSFVDFVKKHEWAAETPFSQKVARYEHSASKDLQAKEVSAARSIFNMSPEVLQAMNAITIPVRVMSEEPQPQPPARKKSIGTLYAKVQDLVRTGEPCNFKEFLPFFYRRDVNFWDVLRCVMDSVFAQGFILGCDRKETLWFSLRSGEKPVLCVPQEVIIAMRFLGTGCSVQERTLFANAMHTAGYPIRTYREFCSTLETTCVAYNIPLQGVKPVENARHFVQYIKKNSPRDRSRLEYKKRYAQEKDIDRREMQLAEKALILLDDLASWEKVLSCEGVATPEQYWAQKNAYLQRVFQEYARIQKECPYYILALFLGNNGGPQEILVRVMHAVFQDDIPIVYNKDRKTYTLRAGENLRPQPKTSAKLFVAEKMAQEGDCGCGMLAYDLYDAGYHMPFHQVTDLYECLSVLCSDQAKNVLKRCQKFITMALDNIPAHNKSIASCLGVYHRTHALLLNTDVTFSASFVRLCHAGVITRKESQDIVGLHLSWNEHTYDVEGFFIAQNLAQQESDKQSLRLRETAGMMV